MPAEILVPFNRLKQAIRVSDAIVSSDQNWGVPGSTVDGKDMFKYERTFGRRSITGHLEQRKYEGKTDFVLDLAGGDGQALRSLFTRQRQLVDAGLTVSLTDQRTDYQKGVDQTRNLSFLTGNLLRATTWREIADWAQQNTPNGKFDLIVCRPLSGGDISLPAQFFELMFQRTWSLLNQEGGLLLTQLPRDLMLFVGKEAINDRLNELNSAPGTLVDSDFRKMILKIKRNSIEEIDPSVLEATRDRVEKDIQDWSTKRQTSGERYMYFNNFKCYFVDIPGSFLDLHYSILDALADTKDVVHRDKLTAGKHKLEEYGYSQRYLSRTGAEFIDEIDQVIQRFGINRAQVTKLEKQLDTLWNAGRKEDYHRVNEEIAEILFPAFVYLRALGYNAVPDLTT